MKKISQDPICWIIYELLTTMLCMLGILVLLGIGAQTLVSMMSAVLP